MYYNRLNLLLISSMLLTLVLITIVIFNNTNSNESNIISNTNKDKQVINNNMLTLMYETESGSGEYVETKDTTWPESGYIFNENLSGCENGGELEYNSQNNTVNLLSNSSDQCYVYFDKYDEVWIDNVVATNVTGSSVTLDVSATSENGSITNYYYSLNDNEYVSTSTNPIVIENLNKLTDYNIKIYAIDNTGAKSNIYELNVSTTDISVPIINSVEISNVSHNSISLIVNANSSIGIKRYYFIVNNNLNGIISNNNSITLNDLSPDTSYNIEVFVEDNNGFYSSKFLINSTTLPITLAEYIINYIYEEDGVNGLYYHDGLGLYENNDLELQDYGYRYSGSDYILNNASYNYIFGDLIKLQCGTNNNYNFYNNCTNNTEYFYLSYDNTKTQYVNLKDIIEQALEDNYIKQQINNYVCFGSSLSDCPESNLYRIIGIFGDKVKLIKADFGETNLLGSNGDYGIGFPPSSYYRGSIPPYIPGYFWNYRNSNSVNKLWEESYLNTINLNQNFLNNIGEDWANKISTSTWKSGNLPENSQYTVKQYYDAESNLSNYSAKIALMQLSDYGYGTNPSYWNVSMSNYNNINILENNWIHLGQSENLLSKSSNGPISSGSNGSIYFDRGFNGATGTRPCFYLNSNITYVSGFGTQSDPLRLS